MKNTMCVPSQEREGSVEFKQGSVRYELHQDFVTGLMHIQLQALDENGKAVAYTYTGYHPDTLAECRDKQEFLNTLMRLPINNLLDTMRKAGYEVKC